LPLYLALLIVFLLFSIFFSSSETAYISLQKLRLEYLVDARVGGADRVAKLVRRPERLLSTVLLGNTFVNTAATALATTLAINIWPDHGVLISTIGLTIILLIFCETTPKTFAALHTERLALTFGRPLELVTWLFTPFVVALSWIASRFSKLVGVKPAPGSLVSDDEIRTMISLGQRKGEMEDAEAELLDKVFEFGDRPVREVMVPRPEVVAIERGSKIAEFLNLYAEHPLSRFPVYDENMDNVVGILAIKDVLMAQAKGGASKQGIIDDLVRPAHFTPETNRINELFSEMRDHNYRMAVVVDEYGGTAGIVSLTRTTRLLTPIPSRWTAVCGLKKLTRNWNWDFPRVIMRR